METNDGGVSPSSPTEPLAPADCERSSLSLSSSSSLSNSMEILPVSVVLHEILMHLDWQALGSALRTCQQWNRAARQEYFWEQYAKQHWAAHFEKEKYQKPKCKTWKWVCFSKRELDTSVHKKFTGIACSKLEDKRYEGEWEDGQPCGYGTLYWPLTGDRYEGEVKDGTPNGNGVLVWGEGEWKGDKYEGRFLNNKRHGRGKYTWPNGDCYEGEYVNNREHGKGVYKWASGTTYEGDFCEAKQHGFGVHTWASGNKYVGQYANDKQHGFGTHYWISGNKYEGEYFEDKKHGKGVFVEFDGWTIDEQWVDGLPQNIPECLHPTVRDCLKRKICTHAATQSTKARGQLYYSITKSTRGEPFATKTTQKPPRVCAVCAEMCVPKMYGVKLSSPVFGGNLVCDCGVGLDGKCCSTLALHSSASSSSP